MNARSLPPAVGLAAGFAVVVGIVLRVAYLASDPSYPSWIGWIGDEGRWTQLAREWTLFGEVDLRSPLSRTHMILGPLFQAVQALVFGVFGVGMVAARSVSVVAGLVLIGIAAWFLRPRIGPWATAVAVGLLAVQPDLVFFSRVAIPEMASLALQLLAFALLVGAPRTRSRAFWAGVTLAAAMGFKGTVAPALIVFMAIALGTGRSGDPASRWSRCALLLVPVVVPALVFLFGVALAMGSPAGLLSSEGALRDILGFVQLDSVYGAASVLYVGEETVRVNVLLTALWPLGVALAWSGPPDSEERTLFAGALIWATGWIVLWSLLLYFPERYVVHVHVPLIVALGAGLALLRGREDGLKGAITGVPPGAPRRALAAAFVVPLAVQVTAAGFSWAAAAGMPAGGLREHVLVGLLVVLALAGWLASRWSFGAVLALGFGLPFGIAVTWSAADLLVDLSRYWGTADDAAAWIAVVGVGSAGALAALRWVGGANSGARRLVLAYVCALAVVWVADRTDRLARRTYVLEEIRAELVERYPRGSLIGVEASASILVETDFRIRYPGAGGPAPVAVLALVNEESTYVDLRRHRYVADFGVPFGPRHYYEDPAWDRLRIYERVEGPGDDSLELRPGSP